MEARTDARLRLAELAVNLPRPRGFSPRRCSADYRRARQPNRLKLLPARCCVSSAPGRRSRTRSRKHSERVAIPTRHRWQRREGVPRADHGIDPGSLVAIAAATPSPPRISKTLRDMASRRSTLQKRCAIGVVQPAYQLAQSDQPIQILGESHASNHGAYQPRTIDLAQVVRDVCTWRRSEACRFESAPASDRTEVSREIRRAVGGLGTAWRGFCSGRECFERPFANAAGIPAARVD